MPDAANRVLRARATVVHRGDSELCQPAVTLIEVLEKDGAAGHGQLFLRPADLYSIGKEAVDAVMVLLRET